MLKRLSFCLAFAASTAAAADPLRMCFREDAPPFSARHSNGGFEGYSVDLCHSIANLMGNDVPEITPVTVESRFDVLSAGTCDLLCGATTINMSRRERFDFSFITFVTDTAFLFPRPLMRGFPDNAPPVRIGFTKNTTTDIHIGLGRIFGDDMFQIDEVPLDSHDAAANALIEGQVDGYIADRDILVALVEAHPSLSKSHVIGTRGLTYEPYALAIRKGAGDLKQQVDQALAQIFADGSAQALVDQHVPTRKNDTLMHALFQIQSIPD